MKADPGHYKASYTLLSCLQGLGKEKEASQLQEKFRRLDVNTRRIDQIVRIKLPKAPRDPNLYYELGRLWFENERKKEAVRWLYEALKLDPNHRQSHELLVRYYQEIGDTKGIEIAPAYGDDGSRRILRNIAHESSSTKAVEGSDTYGHPNSAPAAQGLWSVMPRIVIVGGSGISTCNQE